MLDITKDYGLGLNEVTQDTWDENFKIVQDSVDKIIGKQKEVGFNASGRRYNLSETSRALGTEQVGTTAFNDFMWRPGSAPISFSPQDTIIGTKGGLGGGSVVINQTNNINVSNMEEMERMINDNNSRLVDDVRRITKGAV